MPRPQKKYHYIYKTTCIITSKFYVGMHSTNVLDDGYLGSGKILSYSRAKHGDVNHRKEIVEFLPSREALKLREKEIVNEELLADPLNINLKYGGDGGFDHLNNPKWLWQKKSAGLIGNRAFILKLKTDENFKNLFCIAQKRSLIKQYKNGRIVSGAFSNLQLEMSIRAKSPLAARKRKETFAKNNHQQGYRNSQFGTCWMFKEKAIKIKKQDIDSYLANGFVRGRK